MTPKELTLAAVGCSGPVSELFVSGFLSQGVRLRLLARNPGALSSRYPGAETVRGSLMNPADVERVMDGVDAAFLLTPMGLRDDGSAEGAAAPSVLAGAKASGLKHLIYTSVLGADQLRGVGILDAKVHVERLIAESGVPRTVLRCGSYMEDVFDSRLALLNRGIFLFPVTKDRRFSYTSQRDVPRFVVEELLTKGRILNRAFNFVTPGTFAVRDVERLLTEASGRPIRAPRKFPTYYAFMALLPYFNRIGHRFSSILPLIRYFDRHGYTDGGTTVQELFPGFRMTTLEEHFRKLWPGRA